MTKACDSSADVWMCVCVLEGERERKVNLLFFNYNCLRSNLVTVNTHQFQGISWHFPEKNYSICPSTFRNVKDWVLSNISVKNLEIPNRIVCDRQLSDIEIFLETQNVLQKHSFMQNFLDESFQKYILTLYPSSN